jgi:chemotaxis receptor (MCP) glutamine deamidase CheD
MITKMETSIIGVIPDVRTIIIGQLKDRPIEVVASDIAGVADFEVCFGVVNGAVTVDDVGLELSSGIGDNDNKGQKVG